MVEQRQGCMAIFCARYYEEIAGGMGMDIMILVALATIEISGMEEKIEV
jgi:hypothetical protein